MAILIIGQFHASEVQTSKLQRKIVILSSRRAGHQIQRNGSFEPVSSFGSERVTN